MGVSASAGILGQGPARARRWERGGAATAVRMLLPPGAHPQRQSVTSVGSNPFTLSRSRAHHCRYHAALRSGLASLQRAARPCGSLAAAIARPSTLALARSCSLRPLGPADPWPRPASPARRDGACDLLALTDAGRGAELALVPARTPACIRGLPPQTALRERRREGSAAGAACGPLRPAARGCRTARQARRRVGARPRALLPQGQHGHHALHGAHVRGGLHAERAQTRMQWLRRGRAIEAACQQGRSARIRRGRGGRGACMRGHVGAARRGAVPRQRVRRQRPEQSAARRRARAHDLQRPAARTTRHGCVPRELGEHAQAAQVFSMSQAGTQAGRLQRMRARRGWRHKARYKSSAPTSRGGRAARLHARSPARA